MSISSLVFLGAVTFVEYVRGFELREVFLRVVVSLGLILVARLLRQKRNQVVPQHAAGLINFLEHPDALFVGFGGIRGIGHDSVYVGDYQIQVLLES